MTNQEFLGHLVRLGACYETIEFVRKRPSCDARKLWDECPRIYWLLWLGEAVGLHEDLRALACDYAERVLPIWESWAREHLGESRAAIDAARRGESAYADAAIAATYAAVEAVDRRAERAWQLAHTRSVLTWDRIEKALVTP